jgi:hypothetical protein
VIYQHLLVWVRCGAPEAVIAEFDQLFLHNLDSSSEEALHAVYRLALIGNEPAFRSTLKRACYIAVNNWAKTRQYAAIADLIALFDQSQITYTDTLSPSLGRLRQWVRAFVASADYRDLQTLAARYLGHGTARPTWGSVGEVDPELGTWAVGKAAQPWRDRHLAHHLIAQAADRHNPREQRELALGMAKQIRDRFKFDLAMYVARSQVRSRLGGGAAAPGSEDRPYPRAHGHPAPVNPTCLGDRALQIVKTIVLRGDRRAYERQAAQLLAQLHAVRYRDFKARWVDYLLTTDPATSGAGTLEHRLRQTLQTIYANHDRDLVSDRLILLTCHRAIELLLVNMRQGNVRQGNMHQGNVRQGNMHQGDRPEPSALFVRLMASGSPLTLAILLLKIVLLSPTSRLHLDLCVAKLLDYYDQVSPAETSPATTSESLPPDHPPQDWMGYFVDILNVTFAVHAENVRYSLVRMDVGNGEVCTALSAEQLADYRLFSQVEQPHPFGSFSDPLSPHQTHAESPRRSPPCLLRPEY